MFPIIEFSALFALFVACVVAVGVAAELVNTGRAGQRLKSFRWARFFLRLWILATIAWMYGLLWFGDSLDFPSLISAVVLPSGFALAIGVAMRWVIVGPSSDPSESD
jgi:hypothetical protein